MNEEFYLKLRNDSAAGFFLTDESALQILISDQLELLPLLNAAYELRKQFVGKSVSIHILNNAQNGYCPEDCHYCAQAKSSQAGIEEYPLKSDEEILTEAKNAYEKGAHRYCMVFAGRGPSQKRTEHLAALIQKIKSQYPVEVCVSAGLLDEGKAKILKNAGLDRLNHNLNTSQRHYPKICTTHTYKDRLNTMKAARQVGLQICSGVIAGMGEGPEDIIEMAKTVAKMEVSSIPVNFYMPIEGVSLGNHVTLTPEYCLRVLCLFRFLNPKAEIRIAAGREIHLRSMEVMALYPANSLFLDGYLNTKGEERQRTFQMIKDAGFTIKSEIPLDEFIQDELNPKISLKNKEDLHFLKSL
ncbi:Biotin synthase [hydrothermal vent metagenome]|uniref:biotin synthase n=1 Tax=hydrothermal vent metagenome TaxID=652676 RepID=A0A3B1D8N3_9ZZZZ